MKRIQKSYIVNDLKTKLLFLIGPRQVGKTWLAKDIATEYEHPLYMNYDSLKDREIILEEAWQPNTDLLIFDEIHKMTGWKNYLKGIYDNKPAHLHMLVTGSARLGAFRHSGDSLAGRFFVHHLLPFSYKESLIDAKYPLDHLIERGGFPEPLKAENLDQVLRWRTLYSDSLIQDEIIDFQNIQELGTMKTLLKMLQKKVGSPISYFSLAQDLDKSPHTVKKYIKILEALYIVFLISPYSRNIARSLKKEPKLYFYDSGMVDGDKGIIFENYLAVSLLKHCQHLADVQGQNWRLQYFRTKDKKEVDFCLVKNDLPQLLIEAKTSDESISKSLWYFHDKYNIPATQVVRYLQKERMKQDISLRRAESFLSELIV